MKEIKEVIIFFLDGIYVLITAAIFVMGIVLCVDVASTHHYPFAKIGVAIVCISLFLVLLKTFLKRNGG